MSQKIILLVEDNSSDIGLTRRALNQSVLANQTVVVEDGQEALDYLFSSQPALELPALILLDIKLPRVDGFEVLRRIRAEKRTHRIPVVIFTSSSEEQDIAESYDLGANSYIRKPVDFTLFAQTIQQLHLYWVGLNKTPPKVRI